MAYTKEEIINKCEDALKNPSTFYQADVINYRGKTADGILYNEIVAEFVCDNFDKLAFGIDNIGTSVNNGFSKIIFTGGWIHMILLYK